MKFFIIVIAVLLVSGCNHIAIKDIHPRACGPVAISNVTTETKHPATAKAVSNEIRGHAIAGNCLRVILSIFNKDAALITWPWEIKDELKRRGFTVREKSGSREEMLKYFNEEIATNKEIIAIVLLKDDSRMRYHWQAFPGDRDIPTFFGKYTIICSIYMLSGS